MTVKTFVLIMQCEADTAEHVVAALMRQECVKSFSFEDITAGPRSIHDSPAKRAGLTNPRNRPPGNTLPPSRMTP